MPIGSHKDAEGQISNTSSSGYFDVGNLRIQWGTIAGGQTSPALTFPMPFKTNAYKFVSNIVNGSTANVYCINIVTNSKTTTGLQLYKNFANSSGIGTAPGEAIDWIAIGMKP